MIRNLFFSVLAVFAFAKIEAQNYQISFAGSTAVVIETVDVENLTQGTTLTLSGTDILQLVANVGINQPSQRTADLSIFPNPSTNISNIAFTMQNPGNAHFSLFDIAGKNVASKQAVLDAGLQSFVITNLQEGFYTFTINTENKFLSGKIVSHRPSEGDLISGRLNIETKPFGGNLFKNGKSLVQMQYNDGDLLLFTAFAENYVALSTLIPTQSTTVIFNFITATDFDGNIYGTLAIGSQTWLSQNIKTTHYPDGTPIPLVTDPIEWANLGDNNSDAAYCWYNNDEFSFKDMYGALYTFAAATNGDFSGTNVQGVCPDGWHLPNDAEWSQLDDYLAANGFSGIEGIALKATNGWFNPGNGTNNYGFSALPCGYRNYLDGNFELATLYGYMWSSTQTTEHFAWNRYFSFSYEYIGRYLANKSIGFSVRCIKN